MAETRVSQAHFDLDTKYFNDAAKICHDLAKQLTECKNGMDKKKDDLMFHWGGEGRNTFEKKYHSLSQQFGDISDALYDIAETIYDAEEAYIQADLELAKALTADEGGEGDQGRY